MIEIKFNIRVSRTIFPPNSSIVLVVQLVCTLYSECTNQPKPKSSAVSYAGEGADV